MTSSRGARVTAAVLRCFIGLVLLATGAGKVLDLRGFAEVLRSYEAVPDSWLPPLAAAVPAVELLLGLWLVSGRRLAAASLVSCAVHLAYAAWSAAALLRGLRLSNCGCFGVFWARPLTGLTVAEDLGLAGLSLAVFACARRLREAP